MFYLATKLFQELPDTNFSELACTVKFLSFCFFGGPFKINFILSLGVHPDIKIDFISDYNFGHILQEPCNFCKIVNGAFLTWSGIFIGLGWGVRETGHGNSACVL